MPSPTDIAWAGANWPYELVADKFRCQRHANGLLLFVMMKKLVLDDALVRAQVRFITVVSISSKLPLRLSSASMHAGLFFFCVWVGAWPATIVRAWRSA